MHGLLFYCTVSPMHTIYRKQNYRNIRLDDHTEGETVGVLTRDGRTHQMRWLGFRVYQAGRCAELDRSAGEVGDFTGGEGGSAAGAVCSGVSGGGKGMR